MNFNSMINRYVTRTTGEAFDKAARLLGMKMSGSGGAAVEAAARAGNADTYRSFFTVPMRDKPNCDFSYAGDLSCYCGY
jgi:N6-L-threonylcarbamoyladenine synthase